MTAIFRTVEADLTTVRVDLATLTNNPSASSGFGVLAETDIGEIDMDAEFLKSSAPGGSLAFASEDIVSSAFMIEAKHTSYVNLKTLFRTLQAELRTGGIFEWRPDGDSESLFVKFFPSPIPSMFRGSSAYANLDVLNDFHTQFPVILRRQPYGSSPEATLANAVALTNTVGGMETTVTSTGTVPSPARLEVAVASASAEIVRGIFSIKSGTSAELTTLAGAYSFEAEGATLTHGTVSTAAVGTTSGDAYGKTTYTDTGNLRRRYEKTLTLIPGTYRVYPIFRVTAATKQTLLLKWGNRDVDPIDRTGEEIPIDLQEATGTPWTTKEVGKVTIPEGTSALTLELWSRLDVGTGALGAAAGTEVLDVDYFILVPADGKVTTASVIGWSGGKPAKERFLGSDLLTPTSPAATFSAGTVDDTAMVFDTNLQAGGANPNAGTIYPAGKLVVTLHATIIQEAGEPRQKFGEIRIRNVTGASNTSRDIYSSKNRRETEIVKEVTVSTDGTSNYQPQYVQTATIAGGSVIVTSIDTKFVRTIQDGLKMVIGSDPEDDGVYSGSTKIAPLYVSGARPTLEPGASQITCQLGGWSGGAYQNDVSDEPLPKIDFDRAYTLTVKSKPQHPL